MRFYILFVGNFTFDSLSHGVDPWCKRGQVLHGKIGLSFHHHRTFGFKDKFDIFNCRFLCLYMKLLY